MSKAVLVIDMPESCSECMFMYEFGGIKKCQLLNIFNNGCGMISQNNFTSEIHEKCPFRPLPRKKNVIGIDGATGLKEIELHGRQKGWNNCIDTITGNK